MSLQINQKTNEPNQTLLDHWWLWKQQKNISNFNWSTISYLGKELHSKSNLKSLCSGFDRTIWTHSYLQDLIGGREDNKLSGRALTPSISPNGRRSMRSFSISNLYKPHHLPLKTNYKNILRKMFNLCDSCQEYSQLDI